jgi:hypothetical protein
MRRPRPEDAPMMSHVLLMMILLLIGTHPSNSLVPSTLPGAVGRFRLRGAVCGDQRRSVIVPDHGIAVPQSLSW